MSSNFSASFGNMELTVTPDKMHQTATSLEKRISKTKSLFSQMVNIISSTSQYWDGAVADQERSNFVNEDENFEAMISNLTNYVDELSAITSIYEVTERVQTEISQSLPANILK